MTAFSDLKKTVAGRDFLDTWFKWVGYFLIVATLIATGMKAESYLLQFMGYVSGLALLCHSTAFLVDFFKRYEYEDENAWINVLIMMTLTIFIAFLVGSVAQVIEVAIGDVPR